MRKILTAFVAVAAIGAAVVATSSTADARWYGRGGWGWGPGPFFGGLAAGAIVGGALAAPYYYPYRYYGYAPYPYYGPGCRPAWARGCY